MSLRMEISDSDVRLPFPRLIVFGSLAVPLATLLLPLAVYLPPYYAGSVGLGLAVAGPVFMVAKFWDVLTDPVMGIVSDRFPAKTGRRRHWILLGIPFLVIGSIFLFAPLFLFESVGWPYLLFWLVVLYVGWTMVTLNHYSWGMELNSAYHERSRIQGTIQALSSLGMLVGIIIPIVAVIMGYSIGVGLAALGVYLVVMLPLCALTGAFMAPEVRHKPKPHEKGETRRAFKALIKNPLLLRLLIVFVLDGFMATTVASLFLLFGKYALGLSDLYIYLLLFGYFTCGILCTPLWIKVSYRLGKHKTLVAALGYTVCTVPILLFLPYENFAVAFIGFVIFGANFGATGFLSRSILSDVVDVDRLKSGQHRTGLFFSMLTLSIKIGAALPLGTIWPLLAWLGFQAEGENTREAIDYMRYFYVGTPVLLATLMAVIMWHFPLDEAEHERLRREIDEQEKAELDRLPPQVLADD